MSGSSTRFYDPHKTMADIVEDPTSVEVLPEVVLEEEPDQDEDEDEFSDTVQQKSSVTIKKVILAPRIGGVWNGVVWTGGKPTSADRRVTDLTEPRTPFCLRPGTATGGFKIYSKQTEVDPEGGLFGRTNHLAVFEHKFLDHLERTGMDTLPWMIVLGHKDFINLITKHSSTTVDHVENYYDTALSLGHIDTFEKKNGEAAKRWLLGAIEPGLRAVLYAKLDRDSHVMVVWMTLVQEIRSESYRYFESLKSQIKLLKLADYPGDNVKEFTQAYALLTDEMETANLMEPHFIVLFITALTKTSVNLFVITMSGLLTRALEYNRRVRFLSEEDIRLIPAEDRMSIRKTRAVADTFYQELFEGGEWSPALSGGDLQPAPQANMAVTEFTQAQIHALVQKAYQAGKDGDTDDVECYGCHGKGHYSNSPKCPLNKNGGGLKEGRVTSWKKTPPKDGEPQVKTISKDGVEVIYYWCAKCKRWTTSHNTLKHGRQGDDPVLPASSPPAAPAAANMASGALVSSYGDSDSEDDGGGAWNPV